MEKLELLYFVAESINQSNRSWNAVWGLTMKLPMIPSNFTLGIYPKEIKTQVCTETCSHMLTDAITTIVKWKNVDSPNIHQQENKLYFINNDSTFIWVNKSQKTLCWIMEPDTKENKLKDYIYMKSPNK